jgi:hypothetical protein
LQIENCKLEIANFAHETIAIANPLTCKLTSGSWSSSLARGHARWFEINSEANPSICRLHFSILNFQFLRLAIALCVFLLMLCAAAPAQIATDKTVATVTNGTRANPDLITYSDLVWQLTLEPGVFDAHPGSPELNRALKTLEDQLLVLQEARKLPLAQTPEAQKEFDDQVKQKRDELAQIIGPRALEERMARVGLTSEQLNAILRDRVTIERYLDFRFRAFVLVSAKEIADRYEKIYGPQRNGGKLVPTPDQARDTIERQLTEEKIAEQIGKFIDDLHDQPGTEIVVLNPV